MKTDEIVYFDKFLRYISYWVCSTIIIEKIVKEVWINKKLVDKFLFLVENTFILKLIPSFYKNKQKEISKHKKAYFSDLWFLRKSLWISFIEWDIKWKFIENFVLLELLKYKENLEEIYFYSKKSQSEIDFIIQNNFNWKISAIEVKSWSKDNIPIIFKSFLEDYYDIINKFYLKNNNIIKKRELWNKEVDIISYLNLFREFLKIK